MILYWWNIWVYGICPELICPEFHLSEITPVQTSSVLNYAFSHKPSFNFYSLNKLKQSSLPLTSRAIWSHVCSHWSRRIAEHAITMRDGSQLT